MGEQLIAMVQYGDYRGTAAGDDDGGLLSLAKTCGIDLGTYFLVGIEVDNDQLCVLVVKRDETGERYEEIEKAAKGSKELSITRIYTKANLAELQKALKRFSIVMTSKLVRVLKDDGVRVEVDRVIDEDGEEREI